MGNQNVILSSKSRKLFHFLNLNIVQYLMKILSNFIPVDISCVYTVFPSYHFYIVIHNHSSCKYKKDIVFSYSYLYIKRLLITQFLYLLNILSYGICFLYKIFKNKYMYF